MSEFVNSFNVSKGIESQLAVKIYAQLRTGDIISGKELKSRLTTEKKISDPSFSKAIKLLGQILRSAGYELNESIEGRERKYHLSDIAPIDYILYMGNIGPMISASNDYILNNSGLIPILFDHIKKKNVISFGYAPFGSKRFKVTIHPHLVKEYNGRWFLFGFTYNNKSKGMQISNYALDRIATEMGVVDYYEYEQPKEDTYKEYFKDIIGVSCPRSEAVDIILHTNSVWGHGYVVTKKIHASLEEVQAYDPGLGYGKVKLHVKINRELINYLLSMGENITIESPDVLVNEYVDLVKKMIGYYHSK